MKKINKPKILWLSDIHFVSDITSTSFTKEDNKRYYDDLVNSFDLDVTHIIITGDLAFSNQEKEYNDLNELFIQKIRTRYNNEVTIISICGNHDTSQKLFTKFDVQQIEKIATASDLNELEKKQIEAILEKSRVEKIKKLSTRRDQLMHDVIITKDGKHKLDEGNQLCKNTKNYRAFFKKHILPSLKEKQELDELELILYEELQGLVGIVYDKKYNLIFVCLNSSWFSYGDGNIIKNMEIIELNNILNNLEFGNLELGPIGMIINELKNIQVRMILSESPVIGLMHHPMSFLGYYNHYDEKSDFNQICNYFQMLLTGHVHVKFFEPTIYRGKFYSLEASQLFDYKFAKKTPIKNPDNLGFNYITVNHELKNFAIQNYEFDYDNNRSKITPVKKSKPEFDSTLLPFLRDEYFEFKSRKSVFHSFKNINDVKEYFQKRKSKINSVNDFNVLARELITPALNKIESKNSLENSTTYFNYKIIDSSKKVIGIIDFKLFEFKAEEFIQICINHVEKFLKINSETQEIQLLFFDFWIMELYFKNENSLPLNDRNDLQNYTAAYSYFDRLFNVVKHKVFTKKNQALYPNTSLNYEFLNLEFYKEFL